ncbi:cell division protein SepF [Psychrilyobacter atlanticus]|uniref:cell division protein SepF n=1 Tax=Psychrilyobacter atlanticus TaxID=271091 RepID=UPI0004205645|nr:cell division protein SepF [Psychrilyobacter atlanticus]
MELFKNFKQVLGFEGAEELNETEDDIMVEMDGEEKEEEELSVPSSPTATPSLKSNVYKNSENISDYQTIFVSPINFEECKKIANYINKEKIVTVNLESLSNESAQRMLDFLSGAMEVKKARFITVSKKVYVSVPDGIKSYVEDENNEIFG